MESLQEAFHFLRLKEIYSVHKADQLLNEENEEENL
ncbi:MAG: hypothetical protein Nkreftii_000508 [Candidatus Nitrospira kreftii]|uniref:Uncharacterized protein n=1 Tax=Candidatus Nitrospira kreftii TaxID=2652173 RepID=A0A7S8FAY2_9BACT|nr:MAG: hypothetical protein Nkreftii_000508 [Candidatus Nitrospira kreftii]